MNKKIISALLALSMTTPAFAATVDNITFDKTQGKMIISGGVAGGTIAIEVLKRYGIGEEENRLEYAGFSNNQNGKYEKSLMIKNEAGIYTLKVNDGVSSEQKVIYIGEISTDGINTNVSGDVEIGDIIKCTTNIYSTAATDKKVHYSIAAYDNEGRLADVSMKTTTVKPGEKTLEFDAVVEATPGISRVKILLFDDNMTPLGVSEPINVLKYKELYVSANDGSDENDGETLETPLKSLSAAIDMAGDAGTAIYLREGEYSEDLTLNGKKNISIASYENEEAVITNSVTLNPADFTAVTDENVKTRLGANASKVLEYDLSAHGIQNAGIIPEITYGKDPATTYDVLTVNDQKATIARYPNEGYTQIFTRVSDENTGFKYIYTDAAKWVGLSDLWICGYFANGWEQDTRQATVTKVDEQIDGKMPGYHYQFNWENPLSMNITGGLPGGRFYVFNIPEELDSVNEWYVNKETNKLYIYPGEDFANAEIKLSTSDEVMFNISNSNDIAFSNLKFENIKGKAITASNSYNISVMNSEFNAISNDVIGLGGYNSVVYGNKLNNLGAAGIHLNGGDVNTLASGNGLVKNNTITNFAKDLRVYNPAIALVGVGMTASHNTISDGPHVAIQLAQNEHIVEYNDIRRVLSETGDAGAIYCGRNLLGNGNIIRYNYISDFKPVTYKDQYGVSIKYTGIENLIGIYLDDMFSGASVYGNVLDNVDEGILMGGGGNNVIEDNIIMNKTADSNAIEADARGTDGRNVDEIVKKAFQYNYGVWKLKYPEAKTLVENVLKTGTNGEGYRISPINNIIRNNKIYNHNAVNIEPSIASNGIVSNNTAVSAAPDISGLLSEVGAEK